MSAINERLTELYELAHAQCEGVLDAQRCARLDELVVGDAELRRLYILYMQLNAWAELEAREGGLVAEESVAGGPWPGVHKGEGGTGKAETILAGGRWSVAGGEESGVRSQESEVGVQGSLDAAANPPATFLLPAFPTPEIPKSRNPQIPLPPSTIHHPSFFSAAWQGAASFFSQEVPFAILVTLGIFAIAGLIGSQITITHPTQYAAMPGYSAGAAGAARAGGERVPPSPSAPKAPEAPESKIPEVAQITGMVDCEFSDNLAPMHHRIGIGHNNKFALKKGLMEITYFSGARVILQGPCTYEIDSAAGGFLSIGKLTARVETVKPQAANQKSEIINHKSSNPQSPIPNPFVVKTPTAVVTDLGTEFGVEVERSGETFSRVFQGTVAIQWARDGLPVEGAEVRLGANEAARVGREGGRPVVIRSDARAGARSFVRQISRRVVPKLLSLLEFERSCENAAPGAPSGVLRGEAAFVPGKIGRHAVAFDGTSGYLDATTEGFPKASAFGAASNGLWRGTVAFWVKKPSLSTTSNECILAAVNEHIEANFQVATGLPPGAKDGDTRSLRLYVRSDAGRQGFFDVGMIDADWVGDAWRHVTVAWNLTSGSELTGEAAFFVDGQPQRHAFWMLGQQYNNFTAECAFSPWNNPVRIGAGSRAVAQDFFKGSLDDLAVWNGPLGQAEVNALCQLGNDPVLSYGAKDVQILFEIFACGEGAEGMTHDGRTWRFASGLMGSPGEVIDHEAVVLDERGNGLRVVATPPSKPDNVNAENGGKSTNPAEQAGEAKTPPRSLTSGDSLDDAKFIDDHFQRVRGGPRDHRLGSSILDTGSPQGAMS